MKIFKQLRKCKLFEGFTDAEVNGLFDSLKARIVRYSRGQLVAKDNTEMNEIAVILEGNLVEFSVGANKKREVIRSLVDGEIFGLPQTYCRPNILGYYVVAALDSTILYVAKDFYLTTSAESCPPISALTDNLIRALGEKAVEMENNNAYITIKRMKKKIAKLIYDKHLAQKSMTVDLGMNRNETAKFLSVSRPSMCRELMAMKNEGLFDVEKNVVTIKNLAALKKIIDEMA